MNNLMTILKLLPAIIEAIKAIELAVPEGTSGKIKLQAIIDIATQVDSTVSNIIPQLISTISVVVGMFNAIGVFKKKAESV